MNLRLNVLHPKLNFRAHGNFDLPIAIPKRDDVLDLSSIHSALPQVTVESIYHFAHGVEVNCHLPAKIAKAKCEKLFRYQDGWETYG